MLAQDPDLGQLSIAEIEREIRATKQRIRDRLREQDRDLLLMLLADARALEASLTRPPEAARSN